MPKRKSDDCERIEQKIRKLEKKLRRKRRRSRGRYYSDESESTSTSRLSRRSPLNNQDNDLLDHEEPNVNREIILNDPLSNEAQTDTNPSQLEPEPEMDPVPCSSRNENVSLPSSVVLVANAGNPSIPSCLEPVLQAESTETVTTEDLELDSELLDILGTDPTIDKKYGKEIQKDLSIRLQHWTTVGLSKELRKELKEKYLTPENCKLIDPPELNAEIKVAVSDIIVKRDKAIENKQRQMTAAISCLGEAITLTLSAKEKNTTLLKLLMDAARIICDCQNADSTTRRNFLLNSVNKEIREQVQNTKIDKLLFGENLAETLKTAKAINKSGTELKPSTSKPQNKKPTQKIGNSSRNLNWKGQGPVRRLTVPTKTKEPVRIQTRSRLNNSSKQYQHPQQRPNYNRR